MNLPNENLSLIGSDTPRFSQISQFQNEIEVLFDVKFKSYHDFWKWTTENSTDFWRIWSEKSGIKFQLPPGNQPRDIYEPGDHFWDGKWFPRSRLNFAENLLRNTNPDSVSIHFQPEVGTLPARYINNRLLFQEVSNLYHYLKASGVKKGDRIAAVLPNSPESIIGMLATTALGAVWTSASPDFGVQGILDRFSQVEPKIIVLCNGYFFKGKEISCMEKWKEVIQGITGLEEVILWNFTRPNESFNVFGLNSVKTRYSKSRYIHISYWEDIQTESSPPPITFEPIGFQDPVYIMYSSGTTGLPKCIVQGAGVLLNHTKELILHCDLRKNESITYYTTCGWMMWNWVASSLFVGSRLCMYDGNPFYPDPNTLWRWVDRERIHIYGTSAKYIAVLQKEKAQPGLECKLDSLRMILSTGSPLPASGYDYIYKSVKDGIHISSISGGTDLNGCFLLGNPDLPVHKGELQCIGLGMAVSIYNENGEPVAEEKGELVCEKPFPSMPLYFWKDESGEKYKDAYFSKFPDSWCHGDYVELTKNNGFIIYGRSDATLNPGGVRIGTADIYNVLENIPEIIDSVIVGQSWEDDIRVILFIAIEDGEGHFLDKELEDKIRKLIRESTSPRHIPSLIFRVKEVPYTVNGKKVELAIKNITEAMPIRNAHVLANPGCLDEYRTIANLYLSQNFNL